MWQNNFFWTEFALGFGATKDRVDPIGSDNRSAKQILMPITRKTIPELYHLKIVGLRRRSEKESIEAKLHITYEQKKKSIDIHVNFDEKTRFGPIGEQTKKLPGNNGN